MPKVDMIEISWEGPCAPDLIKDSYLRGHDYGIYQIYGTHNVLGPDTLLYIGKAAERPFGVRIKEHLAEWMEWEPNSVLVYLGRLGGTEPMTEAEWPIWEELIDRAERLLVYYCAPPYNNQLLKRLGKMPPTILLNYRQRNRLPIEVSTLWDRSFISTNKWHFYGE